LDPHVSYAVRVKALSLDGRFGNFSDVVYITRVDQGDFLISAFFCLNFAIHSGTYQLRDKTGKTTDVSQCCRRGSGGTSRNGGMLKLRDRYTGSPQKSRPL